MADTQASKVKQKKRGLGLYQQNILTKKVQLPYNVIGNNIAENIHKKLSETISGKCIKEGYIKTNSIRLISYSAGVIVDKYLKRKLSIKFDSKKTFIQNLIFV